jgi:hypothetical protein
VYKAMFENSTWQASTKVMGSNTSIWPMSLENRFRTLPEPHRTNAENHVRSETLSEKCPTSNARIIFIPPAMFSILY